MDTEYHGAAASSNNTDELTAIGKALTWLNLQPPSTTSRYEICSDSSYALDALDLADPPIECRSRTKPSSVGVLRDSKQFVARGTSCSSGRSRLTAQTNLSTLEETTAPTAELARRRDQDRYLTADISHSPLSPVRISTPPPLCMNTSCWKHGACWTPAEETTEEPMIVVDKVASEPIIN